MDPFTIALATFGVQKLRGKSTSRALRDAALAGGIGYGIGQLGGAGLGIGQGSAFSSLGFGANTMNTLEAAKVGASGGIPSLTANAAGAPGTLGFNAAGQAIPSALEYTASQLPAAVSSAAPTGFLGKAGELYGKLGTAEKIGLGVAGASLLGGEEEPQEPVPGTTPEERAAAQAQATAQMDNLTSKRGTMPTYSGSPYNYDSNFYTFNTGGIVSALPKFSVGGINYLPSKQTHDENDVHNYVRATGYVEDGSGNGDKDEDTILAQLADGEFVSRADAILGAGIMEGASPSSMKDMRKKGAAFFYDQQAKFKRVYDLLDASRKNN
jgi:hypothetical protein